MRYYYTSIAALFKYVLLLYALNLSLSADAALVVTVTTKKNSTVEQALSAIRTKLPELAPNTKVVSVDETQANQRPALLLTLGSKAIKIAQQQFPSVPILACLIRDEKTLNAYPNASGIVMRHSIEQQLYWFERMLPSAKKIGILYSPKHNGQQVGLLEKAAKLRKLKVVKTPVNNAQGLPSALKAIKRNADSILALIDPIVYSSKTAKGVLLFSFRNKIPLVGLSKIWVKAGALYALDWDYQQLGEQCAVEAAKLLSGQKKDKLNSTTAAMSRYVINLRTAKAMQLTIDQSLIDGASVVFK